MKKTNLIELGIFILCCVTVITAGVLGADTQEKQQPPVILVEIDVEEIEVNATPHTIQVKTMDKYRYIEDCPLSKEIQRGIFDICEKYKVSFELVMAVIQKESNYDVYALGDNCNSVGLMQIQEKWHRELMQELGVNDLYDPLENVEVGVALLAEYLKGGHEVYYVLMKYNGGAEYANRMLESGTISDYAIEVTETAIMYAEQNGI